MQCQIVQRSTVVSWVLRKKIKRVTLVFIQSYPTICLPPQPVIFKQSLMKIRPTIHDILHLKSTACLNDQLNWVETSALKDAKSLSLTLWIIQSTP